MVLKEKVYSVFESQAYFTLPSLNQKTSLTKPYTQGIKNQSDDQNDNYDGSRNDEAVERYDCGYNLWQSNTLFGNGEN